MSKSIPSIQTQTFPLNPNILGFDDFTCKELMFPQKWREIINDIREEENRIREWQPKRADFHKLIASLFPEVLSVQTYYGRNPWIYSLDVLPAKDIRQLVYNWFIANHDKLLNKRPHLAARVEEILNLRMPDDELIWQEKRLDLAKISTNNWNTAEYIKPEYSLLPEILARSLTKTENGLRRTLPYGGAVNFLRAPALDGKGVELISWKPLTDDSEEYFYSIVLKIFIQLVPFEHLPQIAVNVLTRRWVSEENAKLGSDNKTAYLLTKFDKDPIDSGCRFQPTSVFWANENGKFILKYDPVFADLYGKIITTKLPDLTKFLEKPTDYINDEQTKMVLTYSDRMPHEHIISKGSPQKNRAELYKAISKFFVADFDLCPSIAVERTSGKNPTTFAPFYKGEVNNFLKNQIFTSKISEILKGEERNKETVNREISKLCQERRKYLAETCDGIFKFEVWWKSEEMRDTIIKKITEHLGLDPKIKDEKRIWQTPELIIEITLIYSDNLTRPLEISTTETETQNLIAQRRADEVKTKIKQLVNDTEKPTPCIVEISHKDSKQYKPQTLQINGKRKTFQIDPKSSLRIGFAAKNRLAQFINTPEIVKGSKKYNEAVKHLPDAATSSFRDSLRKLGLVGGLPVSKKPELKLIESLNYAAVWIHRRGNRILPIVVFVNSKTEHVFAFAPGLERFVPYPEFLLKLADRKSLGNFNEWFYGYESVADFFKKCIERLLKNGDLLLLVNQQNTREGWVWLMDKNLSPDKISFDWSKYNECRNYENASDWQNLRIVRVRTTEQFEVPQYFAPNPAFGKKPVEKDKKAPNEYSNTKDIFKLTERVFYGLAERPPTMQKAKPHISKSVNQTGLTWGSNLLEMTVCFLQENDTPEDFAWLTHNLRDTGVNFAEEYRLPLPLHLAKKTKEFIPEFVIENEENK